MTQNTKTKLFVLLSGGIDSTTTLAMALTDFPEAEVECVSVDYGQRHKKEMDSAKAVIDHYNNVDEDCIEHHILNLKGQLTGMLVDKDENEEIPNASYADLPHGISPTYVSFRNGTMLSLVAARAQSWIMEQEAIQEMNGDAMDEAGLPFLSYEAVIYCGVHADDGANWAYPDCSPEFIGGMANAIYIGTYNKVRLRAPLLYMSKAAVVREGTRLRAPYGLTWSCYAGEELHCGVCPTCRSRKEAFQLNNLDDPTQYAKSQQQLDDEIPL